MALIVDLKNQINPYDTLIILALAFMTNVFSEFLSWLFIYRTKKHKETKKQIDFLNKKIELSKEGLKGNTKQSDKKVKQQEADLKGLNMEMMKVRISYSFPIKCLDKDVDYFYNRTVYCFLYFFVS